MKLYIREFAELVGVSVRTLHYYDEIGLLKPAGVEAQNGYRFYDEASVLRMQEILFYRELDFPLKSISGILAAPDYNAEAAMARQKQLLILRKERLERIIAALDAAMKGEIVLNAFDNREYEAYKAEVKEKWGQTQAYAEFAEKEKSGGYAEANAGLDRVMGEFAACMQAGHAPGSAEAQALVDRLQGFISEHYYTCTDPILAGLGQMYVADERFRKNIDRHAPGTAEYIAAAIKQHCGKGR